MEKRGLFLIIGVVVFLSYSHLVSATINFYEDFDDYTVDQDWPNMACSGQDTFYYNPHNLEYFPNCHQVINNDYNDRSTPRFGGKYIKLYCDWKTDSSTYPKRSQRASMLLAQDTAWSPCNAMTVDDGTEYWFGYSYYIPADYYQEYCGHMVTQFVEGPDSLCNGNCKLATVGYGGGYGDYLDGKPCSDHDRDYFDGEVYHGGTAGYFRTTSQGLKWTDLKGTWVDFVWHFVWYSTNNANARSEFWINGIQIFSYSGEKNIPHAGQQVIANAPMVYSALATTTYQTFNRWWLENGDADFPEWRKVHMDEYRLTENTIGTKNYCDVAPPIWAAQPAISYPTEGQNNVLASFTAIFDSYSDHRTDSQGCFNSYRMNVQVDENGGDWSTLVYDSGNVSSANTHAITGLSANTAYQMRVRHSSYNSARSEEYWGEWSSTVTFTTIDSCIESWDCTDWSTWSECEGGLQNRTRTCTDDNECGTVNNKPPETETRACGTAGLMAHWTFDSQDISGDQALDKSGFGNDGTIHGAVPVAGRVGEALFFDGEGDYVEVISSDSLNVDYLTVSLWFRADGFTDNAGLFAKGDNSHRQYWAWIFQGNLSVEIDEGGHHDNMYSLQTDVWYHLTVTYDGSSIITFINGDEISNVGQSTGTILSDDDPFRVGNLPGFQYFNGRIDDVKVWNRSLSAQEILDLYDSSFHSADNNPKDGCIRIDELGPAIDDWKYDSTTYTMTWIMEAVTLWSRGTGCVS